MFAQTVYAADSFAGWEIYSLQEIIVVAVAILLFVSVILTIVFMLWGGFLLILSGGNEEKVKPAVSMIRYSIIGLFVVILVVILTPYGTRILWLGEIGDLFSPTQIFKTMGCVKDRLVNQSNVNCLQTVTNTSSGWYRWSSSGGSSSSGLGIDFTDI